VRGRRESGWLSSTRDAEVGDLGVTIFCQQDIRGFQVAMNNALTMSAVQRFRQFEG
jgi:hypothetical protein